MNKIDNYVESLTEMTAKDRWVWYILLIYVTSVMCMGIGMMLGELLRSVTM